MVQFSNTLFEVAFGDALAPSPKGAELKAELASLGIDTTKSWAQTKKMVEALSGKIRLEEARNARLEAEHARSPMTASAVPDSRDSLLDQIRALISFDPSTAVYARKWEDQSVEDLSSLRDSLKRTAEREAARRNVGR